MSDFATPVSISTKDPKTNNKQLFGWLVCEEILLASLCEKKILFRLKIYNRLRQATSQGLHTASLCTPYLVLGPLGLLALLLALRASAPSVPVFPGPQHAQLQRGHRRRWLLLRRARRRRGEGLRRRRRRDAATAAGKSACSWAC